eukprot:8993512-Lingulodinium_polyedra.AAC.1
MIKSIAARVLFGCCSRAAFATLLFTMIAQWITMMQMKHKRARCRGIPHKCRKTEMHNGSDCCLLRCCVGAAGTAWVVLG